VPDPTLTTTPSHRLSLFNQRRTAIEAQFAIGAISIDKRRDLLIAARDDVGITSMRTNAKPTVPLGSTASEESERRRRRRADQRRYARKLASDAVAPMEGGNHG
jgi:hypothetical protein